MISKSSIIEASKRIKPFVNKTPVLTSNTLNELIGSNIFLKCENFQKVGAFKMRGAVNALQKLEKKQLKNGVATHSSGNHAQALAKAAKLMNIKATIIMPENAPEIKVNAVKDYGAEVIFSKSTQESRENTLNEFIQKHGSTFIPPYDDINIIEGQATVAMELINEIPNLDFIFTPIGGGGLCSGSILGAKYFSKNIKVIGCEPEGADDAYRSLKKGVLLKNESVDTIADGLRTNLGEKPYQIIKEGIKDILTVNDQEIQKAMQFVWERLKIIIEPSSAVPLAALFKNKTRFKNLNIGVIISGGNVDLKKTLNLFD